MRPWYLIIGFFALFYLVVAGLIAMPTAGERANSRPEAGEPGADEPPSRFFAPPRMKHHEVVPPSTRDMPPAQKSAYNYQQMAMGGVIVAAMALLTVWVVRRQGRAVQSTVE